MSIYFLVIVGVIAVIVTARYPAQVWLFVAAATLQGYFKLANLDLIVLFPLASGISINLSDMITLTGMLIVIIHWRELQISPQLKALLYLFFASVVVVALFSVFALNASVGVVGNRFRSYAVYFLIPAILFLVRQDKKSHYFVVMLFVIAVSASLLQMIEYTRGQPFLFHWGQVSNKHFTEFSEYDGISRVWNRAMPTVMIVFSMSLLGLLLDRSRRWMFGIIAIICAIATALTLTRTLYVFALSVVIISVILVSTRQAADVMKGLVPATILVALVLLGVNLTGSDHVTGAVTSRLSSISEAASGNTRTTMDDRRIQFEQIMELVGKSNVPPLFGIGITDRSIAAYTSDLGYINIIVNMGLLGLAILVGWLAYLVQWSLKMWDAASDVDTKILAGSVYVSMPGILITGINFDYFTGTYFFWLVTATIFVEITRQRISSGDYRDKEAGFSAKPSTGVRSSP